MAVRAGDHARDTHGMYDLCLPATLSEQVPQVSLYGLTGTCSATGGDTVGLRHVYQWREVTDRPIAERAHAR